jgi:hypothetical protein
MEMTWAQIMAERQQREHEREAELKQWCQEVTEALHREQSSFLKEFSENEQRIFGLIQHP